MRSVVHAASVMARFIAAIAVAGTAIVAAIALVAASGVSIADSVTYDGLRPIALGRLAQRSEVYAADGSVIANLYAEDRVEVGLDQVPQVVRDAVIAVEDDRFFEHDGVSIPAVARALKTNAQAGAVAQGGSTITQQLVKTELLTREKTISRKLREVVLARRMEKAFSKEQILERYLNTVYFGEGAHGAYTAAQRYFAKPLAALTPAEAALLAGQIANPSRYNPFTTPEAATARRAHVLRRMVAEGYLTPEDARRAGDEPLPTERHRLAAEPRDYFAEEVRRQLLDDPRLGATRAERRIKVFRGGLKVHTTLDPALQTAAERAVREGLPESPFTAALVTVNPADGAVLAVVGGKGFEQAKFNLATQGARQPGSSFKPIALAAAIEAGLATEDLVNTQAPCVFQMPPGQPPWTVLNYDGDAGGGVLTLREATVKSSNCAYAQLSMHLGADKIAAMARSMGITRHVLAVPSIALGAVEAAPLEMAAAMATLAADGVYHPPLFIRRVESRDGSILFENQPSGERVMSENTARIVTHVLGEVITRGTGQGAAIGRPAAGKTGTSQEWRDAWFNGYTPHLATSVWMGHPAGQVSMSDVAGKPVTGGSYPARMWSAFMSAASAGLPATEFVGAPAQRPDQQWVGPPPGEVLAAIGALLNQPAPPAEPPKQEERKKGRDD